jgi:hypothetical protein
MIVMEIIIQSIINEVEDYEFILVKELFSQFCYSKRLIYISGNFYVNKIKIFSKRLKSMSLNPLFWLNNFIHDLQLKSIVGLCNILF